MTEKTILTTQGFGLSMNERANELGFTYKEIGRRANIPPSRVEKCLSGEVVKMSEGLKIATAMGLRMHIVEYHNPNDTTARATHAGDGR